MPVAPLEDQSKRPMLATIKVGSKAFAASSNPDLNLVLEACIKVAKDAKVAKAAKVAAAGSRSIRAEDSEPGFSPGRQATSTSNSLEEDNSESMEHIKVDCEAYLRQNLPSL